MKRTLSYATELRVACVQERKSEPRRVEACGDIEQGVLSIEHSSFACVEGKKVASLVGNKQVFYVADHDGVPGEGIEFEAETQLHGYWWEVIIPGHDNQYWFTGKHFADVQHQLPRETVVLRHMQKKIFNSYFPVVSKKMRLQRLIAKATLAAFLLGLVRMQLL